MFILRRNGIENSKPRGVELNFLDKLMSPRTKWKISPNQTLKATTLLESSSHINGGSQKQILLIKTNCYIRRESITLATLNYYLF